MQSFLGFANFYRRFIKGFSELAKPLYELAKKNTPWNWGRAAENVFEDLKTCFCAAPVLVLFDPDLPSVIETDASDYVAAAVHSQVDKDGVMRPIAYLSKKHCPAEINYEIYDKELLAIVLAFQEWRYELQGARHPVQVLSDHKNLEHFMTTKTLTRRQARWSEILADFNFQIKHRPGKLSQKPDALTRRSGDLPKKGDPRLEKQKQILIKPEWVASLKTYDLETGEELEEEDFFTLIKEQQQSDELVRETLDKLRTGARHSKKITLGDCAEKEGALYYRSKFYVPEVQATRVKLMKACHDAPGAGHGGRSKTLDLLQREYYWPAMRKDIARYVRNCHTCSRSKAHRNGPYRVLKALPVPVKRWADWSMDFVTGLPMSNGFDCILVVVDRLTKIRHFIPTNTTIDALGTAELLVRHVVKLHGLPESIVSDRGPQFAALVFKEICRRLGADRRLSTSFRPQTDGQTEVVNAIMEGYLRAYVNYQQDDWEKWLALAEFAANNTRSETLNCSPFFANYGFNPRLGFEPGTPINHVSPAALLIAQDFARDMEALCDLLRAEMQAAQIKYGDHYDSHRVPAPDFKVGDYVWLDGRNIRTKRPSRKLDWKNLGRFKILEKLNSYVYRLELPATIQIHDVFHVEKLRPVSQDPFPGQVIPEQPPVEVDGEQEWEVEEILDAKQVQGGHVKYLVKWTGYDAPTWEAAALITHADEALEAFYRMYPHKPKPRRSSASRRRT